MLMNQKNLAQGKTPFSSPPLPSSSSSLLFIIINSATPTSVKKVKTLGKAVHRLTTYLDVATHYKVSEFLGRRNIGITDGVCEREEEERRGGVREDRGREGRGGVW